MLLGANKHGCFLERVEIPICAIRNDLECDFEFKDYAKAFGANWDPDNKNWYAPAGCDFAPLNDLGVLPCVVADSLRASYTAVELATRAAKCKQCGLSTSGVAAVSSDNDVCPACEALATAHQSGRT